MKKRSMLLGVAFSTLLIPGAVFSGLAGGDAHVLAEEAEVSTKEVRIYKGSSEESKTYQLTYFSDVDSVPYTDFASFYQTFYKGNVETLVEGDTYTLTEDVTYDGKTGTTAVFDVERDTMTVEDSALFFHAKEDDREDDTLPFVRVNTIAVPEGEETAKPVTVDFSDYGIDLRGLDGKLYLPLSTMIDLFCSDSGNQVVYNGEKIYFSGDNEEEETEQVYEDIKNRYPKLLVTGRSEAEADFEYRELCFCIDRNYGFPGKYSEVIRYIRSDGLDAALEKYIPDLKKALKSTDTATYLAGLNYLFNTVLADSGHTGINVEYIMDEEMSKKFQSEELNLEIAGTDLIPGYYTERSEKADEAGEYLSGVKDELLDEDIYVIEKDTMLIDIPEFDLDLDGWKTYSLGLGDIPTDAYGRLYQGLTEAKKQGIKNVVIDVSTNPGGYSSILQCMLELIRGNNLCEYYTDTEQHFSYGLVLDRNLDGEFDEKDAEVDFSDLNIAVNSGKASFSCGNAFVYLMKDLGYPILGDKSGGGCCNVREFSLPTGIPFNCSSKVLVTDSANLDFDEGLTPDYVNATEEEEVEDRYSKFYDLDLLSRECHMFYKDLSAEWLNGYWYEKDGSQTYKAIGSWHKNSKGWWFGDTSGWYAASKWQKINGKWYYFDARGYMVTDAYVSDRYLAKNGVWDGVTVTGWQIAPRGWRYKGTNGEFMRSRWVVINNKWYYFDAKGYMVTNAWVRGFYWIGNNGVWTYKPKGSWHKTAKGWWFGDSSGWYAKDETVMIDSVEYTFDENGYMIED